jgi:allophanate hydrolase
VTLHAPAWGDEMLVRSAQQLQLRAVPASVPRGWMTLVVAGAHLRGQPLEHQLLDRGAVWMGTTATAGCYRLYALDGTVPAKPGLVRTSDDDGEAIEVDLWALAPAAFAAFVSAVPEPLCIGSVRLADGTTSSGFLCEPGALRAAADITRYGGWRPYLASQ